MNKRQYNSFGFTLIEVVATIAVIGLLVIIAVPLAGSVMTSTEDKAKASAIDLIETAGSLADSGDIPLDYTVDEAYSVHTLVNAGLVKPSPEYSELFEGNNVVQRVAEDTYVFKMGVELTDFEWEHINGSDGPVRILRYLGSSKDPIIPATINGGVVTEIGKRAFYGYDISKDIPGMDNSNFTSTIHSVSIPNTVEVIGENAFYFNALNTLTLPDNLKEVGKAAFTSNNIKGEVVIPDGVETIGRSAFSGNGITKAVLPESLTSIDTFAFSNNRLTEWNIPKNITEIPSSLYQGNIGLTGELVIPDHVTKIGDYALHGARWSGDIVIPANVEYIGNTGLGTYGVATSLTFEQGSQLKYIGNSAFGGGAGDAPGAVKIGGFGDVVIPDSVEYIGTWAFRYSGLTSVKIPEGIKRIEDSAFAVNSLVELDIPDSVTYIGPSAFNGAFAEDASLSIVIPEGVTEIGSMAFRVIYNSTITIPNSVSSIGDYGFARVRDSEIYVGAGTSGFEHSVFNSSSGTTIYGPAGSPIAEYAKSFSTISSNPTFVVQ